MSRRKPCILQNAGPGAGGRVPLEREGMSSGMGSHSEC